MSSSKASAKHYIVPQDIFYCIDFFAQPKNRRQHNTSTNHVPPRLKLTMDSVYAVNKEHRKGEGVRRWLDEMPENFSRVPGDSRMQVKQAQQEQLEKERDKETANRMLLLAQQMQPEPNNMGRGLRLNLNVGVEEYLRLIEPDRQRLFEHWHSEAMEAKRQRRKKPTEQLNFYPATPVKGTENDPANKERVRMEQRYSTETEPFPDYGPPPPIPPRSKLRPRPNDMMFSETAPGSIQQAEHLNASSSQYSSVVDVMLRDVTASGSGTSGVRDLEPGVRRDNPGLVAELRLGMERRRQRESARDEELEREREREQESSISKVWALKLWK